jgi:hypothetical protein
MGDYTKFLSIKNQLQKFYNFKAKEEREIIYAVKIIDDQPPIEIKEELPERLLTEKSSYLKTQTEIKQEKVTVNDLIALTKIKDIFYIELLRIDKDINFKYSSNMNMLMKISLKATHHTSDKIVINNVHNNNQELNHNLLLNLAEKNLTINFQNELNLKEFLWCLLHIIAKMKIEKQVQVRGVNYKDLEDFAFKNKFYSFNSIYDEEQKKERIEIEVTDKELEDLSDTLKSLNIESIIYYDLENLNSRIEQFNIETKE